MAKKQKKRILTGDRPTGNLHLGHLAGSLTQRVELQDDYEQFLIIADMQALTDNFDNPEKVRKYTLEVMLDNLSVGVDLAKSTFFVQSQVPAIAELFVIFSNLVTVAEVQRNPTVKQEIAEKRKTKATFKDSPPLGFFVHPVHQAADILCVNSHLVPVGEDQAPMVEITRQVARQFNKIYQTEYFNIPEYKFTKISRLSGTDGQAKMGKSLGNCIYLVDDTETVRQKVRSMYTDPKRKRATDPGTVEGNPVFMYHDAFNDNVEEVAELKERYRAGKVGDVEVKQKLFEALEIVLEPIRERRAYYDQRRKEVEDALQAGTEQVRQISQQIVDEVKEILQIKY